MMARHHRKTSTLWRSPRSFAHWSARVSNSKGGESFVSRNAKFTSLAIYLILNMALIFFNKIALGKVPFPYLLTALHAGTAYAGCLILLLGGLFTPTPPLRADPLRLSAFSVLYTLNIAMSNVSLQFVSIPFHQVVRAAIPVWTVLIYRIIYRRKYTSLTYVSLIPVVAGVGFATYGDYAANASGFMLTLLGSILAAVKTVATNRLQTNNEPLTALELLYRMSPLAMFESLLCAYLAGEVKDFYRYSIIDGKLSSYMLELLGVNGILAFGLNLASFTTNKNVGALAMTVAANLKQIISIVLSVLVFKLTITPMNVLGVIITSFGAVLYTKAELAKKDPVHHVVDMLEKGYGQKQ